jgi:two-component system LytT family response regulator
MRAVIIEDELNGRELLRSAINTFAEGIKVVGEAEDVQTGINIIKTVDPDIIFLDIELPDGKGFDILDHVETSNFKVIFVTAYDDFAIRAIKYAAFDYLLKPLNFQEFRDAISKLDKTPHTRQENLNLLQNRLSGERSSENKLMISNHNGHIMIDLDQIIAVEADGSYVFFIMEDGSKCLAAHSLSYYEELLPDNKFYRIHKSHIVNLTKIKSVDPGRTGSVFLDNGISMEIAARRKSAFLSFLKNYAGS